MTMTRDEQLIRAALEAAATVADVKPRNGRTLSSLHHAGIRDGRSDAARLIRALDPAEVLAKVREVETTAGPWALDTSTGSEILVKGGCSVIEGEDARYLLRLIAADTSTPAPDAVARLVEAARQRDGGTHDPDCKINRTSNPFCCCGHDELMAENARMTKALKFAGDYLEASEKNGLPDLGDASNMPFIADVIAMIDAALAREGEWGAE